MVSYLPNLQLKALWILLTILLAGMIFAAGTLVYPNHILSIKEPFEVLNPVVKRGDILWFKLIYTKNFDLPGTVTTWLEGAHGEYILLPNEDASAVSNVPMTSKGKEGIKIGERRVPGYVPVGRYNILWIAKYDPWRWRSLTYMFRSKCVEIR